MYEQCTHTMSTNETPTAYTGMLSKSNGQVLRVAAVVQLPCFTYNHTSTPQNEHAHVCEILGKGKRVFTENLLPIHLQAPCRYGYVCHASIDCDPDLKYPKGAGRITFSSIVSYRAAVEHRFFHVALGDTTKVEPYVFVNQMCDRCTTVSNN